MPAHLAQVCVFKRDETALRRFCEVVSGRLEVDNGALTSFHMGASTVARHPPVGEFQDGDVLVTLQVASPAEVDSLFERLRSAAVPVDDVPETTEWGWRIFYFRASPHLVFEIGAPAGL
ncbi:MAG: hypothetical protein IPK13_03885 [Deltaproteobacteria bacterium]|nr:hypothetical protein [Deltaproteobacteria bacterium]